MLETSIKKISVIINTLNEEKNIEYCIRSIQGFADEIIVCDMHSDDKTSAIALELGARVIYFPRGGFVTAARYYACTQATGEWIFMLDADERPTQKLLGKYTELSKRDDIDCVVCAVIPYMFGDFVYYGGWYEVQFPRFFRKKLFLDNYNPEHENMPHMDFHAAALAKNKVNLPRDFYIIHFNYDTVQEFVTRTIGKYAADEGKLRASRGESLSWKRLSKKILSYIYYMFIKGKGYKDGRRGWFLAMLLIMYKILIELNIWFYGTQQDKHKEGQTPVR